MKPKNSNFLGIMNAYTMVKVYNEDLKLIGKCPDLPRCIGEFMRKHKDAWIMINEFGDNVTPRKGEY